MSDFAITCHLTGEVIEKNEEALVIMLFERPSYSSLGKTTWDFWSPATVILQGKFNSECEIENVKIFDSLKSLNPQENDNTLNHLLQHFEENFEIEQANKNKIENYLGPKNRVFLIKKDLKAQIVGQYLEMLETNQDKNITEMVLGLLNRQGFENIEKAKEYHQNQKNNHETQEVNFIVFKKNNVQKLLDTYGMEFKNNFNEDVYAQNLQKERLENKKINETIKFVNGEPGYSGSNHPNLTWRQLYNKVSKPSNGIKESLNKLYIQQSMDIAILNEYMRCIGKIWSPALIMDADTATYGQAGALEMQKDLLNNKASQKKLKK